LAEETFAQPVEHAAATNSPVDREAAERAPARGPERSLFLLLTLGVFVELVWLVALGYVVYSLI
jgi:hypothetical protein